jgi:hypothetical protein
MSPTSATLQFQKTAVSKLLADLKAAKYALPALQREFVWDGKRAAALLDSIDRGMPIGSILLWEAPSRRSGWLKQSEQGLFPAFNKLHKTVRVVIDGQQRLTVLYQACQGDSKKNAFGREVNFKRVVLAVRKEDRTEMRFAYRNESPKRYIAVPDILSSNWRSHCRRLGFSSSQTSLVKKTRDRLRSYPLHLILFKAESVDDVSDTFIRINTGGRRLSSADEILAAAQQFSLRRYVRELQRSLAGMDNVSENILLHGFCFVNGKSRVDKSVARSVIRDWQERVKKNSTIREEFDKLWQNYATAVHKAVNLLRNEFSVYGLNFLPSDNMLTTLSYFYFKNSHNDPTASQLRELRRWFWATAAGNRYTGTGYRKNIESDMAYFSELAQKPSSPFKYPPTTSLDDLRRTVFMGRRSLAKAVLCLLAKRKPVNLKTGAQVSIDVVAGRADEKNKHHIFPRAFLRKSGVSNQRINSVVNMCFLPCALNREIGKEPPHQYLTGFQPSSELAKRLRVHLIPKLVLRPLGQRPISSVYREFLIERSRLIAKEMEQEAGIPLFVKED